jgi:hypothetical protein
MPKITYILSIVVSVQLYAIMYAVAASTVWEAFRIPLNPLNLPRILREFVGALARMRGPVVPLTQTWDAVLGLDPEVATELCIDNAVLQLTEQMRARRWAYPASQYQLLEKLADTARYAIYMRDSYREAQEYINSFFQARRQEEHTGWRRVLGLAPCECDVHAIKQAYRKLALQKHPDRGGSNSAMAELNVALAQARNELSFT